VMKVTGLYLTIQAARIAGQWSEVEADAEKSDAVSWNMTPEAKASADVAFAMPSLKAWPT